MKAVILRQPGGLDRLELVDMPDPGAPGVDKVRVRIHASSLNFHDLGVVLGMAPVADRLSRCRAAQAWSRRSLTVWKHSRSGIASSRPFPDMAQRRTDRCRLCHHAPGMASTAAPVSSSSHPRPRSRMRHAAIAMPRLLP